MSLLSLNPGSINIVGLPYIISKYHKFSDIINIKLFKKKKVSSNSLSVFC